MMQISTTWKEAEDMISEFKKAFEERFGVGINISYRLHTIDNLPPLGLNEILYEANELLWELYPNKIVLGSNISIEVHEGILTKTRIRDVVIVRHVFYHMCNEMGYGLVEIGKFTKQNHSTVLNGIKSVNGSLHVKDKLVTDLYEKLKVKLTNKYGRIK